MVKMGDLDGFVGDYIYYPDYFINHESKDSKKKHQPGFNGM